MRNAKNAAGITQLKGIWTSIAKPALLTTAFALLVILFVVAGIFKWSVDTGYLTGRISTPEVLPRPAAPQHSTAKATTNPITTKIVGVYDNRGGAGGAGWLLVLYRDGTFRKRIYSDCFQVFPSSGAYDLTDQSITLNSSGQTERLYRVVHENSEYLLKEDNRDYFVASHDVHTLLAAPKLIASEDVADFLSNHFAAQGISW
jgi:hypothetical protein